MNALSLPAITAERAADVCRDFQLHEDVQPLLADDPAPAQFLQALQERKFFGPALEFLAHGLPKREAVWWGCLCVGAVGQAALKDRERHALRAAVLWVETPDEKHRQAAYGPAQAATLTTAAGSLAQAVYWSGGSMMPPGQAPAVAPMPSMLAQTVHGAVLKARALLPAKPTVYLQRQFLALGLGIAGGKYLWKQE